MSNRDWPSFGNKEVKSPIKDESSAACPSCGEFHHTQPCMVPEKYWKKPEARAFLEGLSLQK